MPNSLIRLGSKLTGICEYPHLSVYFPLVLFIIAHGLPFPLGLASQPPPAPSPPRTPHSNAILPAPPSPMRLLYQSRASMKELPLLQVWAPLKFSRQRQRAASHRLGQMAAPGPMAAAISFVHNSRWQYIRGIRDTDVTFMRCRESQSMTRPSACRIWTSLYLVSHFLPSLLSRWNRYRAHQTLNR